MEDIFSTLLKETGNEYASIAEEGIEAGDITGYIGTGSYSLNALLSGSITGGIPANKVTAFAGEPSTGKTFFALNIVREFQKSNPKAFVYYFESESAISKQMLSDRGIDIKRIGILPVATVQEFRTQAIKILDRYMDDQNRYKVLKEISAKEFYQRMGLPTTGLISVDIISDLLVKAFDSGMAYDIMPQLTEPVLWAFRDLDGIVIHQHST